VAKRRLLPVLRDLGCGLLAYLVARWIWTEAPPFRTLPLEAITFVGVYLLLQFLVRTWRLARAGRKAA
jgi:hypothetical protein